MPKVLENIITAATPHPESGSVTLSWANGATTENSFRHVIGKGVFCAARRHGVFCAGARRRGRAQPRMAGRARFLRRRALVQGAS